MKLTALIALSILLPTSVAHGASWLPLAVAPSGYVGPIDINGTAFAFWSTRCGAKTYSGNILDIWDSATGNTTETVLGCDGAGNIVVKSGSALATTCSGGCNAKTVYDQSGGSHCGGACDITQPTNANRPVVNTALLGGKLGIIFASGSSNCLGGSSFGSIAQAFTISAVYKATSTAKGNIYADSGGSVQFYMHDSGANQVATYAGGAAALVATANDSASHAVQALLNGASSALYVDGSNTSGVNPGTSATSGDPLIGAVGNTTCTSGSQFGDMNWFETGIWSSDKSANNATMNSNQHTYWGF